jgi:hypothetical protein
MKVALEAVGFNDVLNGSGRAAASALRYRDFAAPKTSSTGASLNHAAKLIRYLAAEATGASGT